MKRRSGSEVPLLVVFGGLPGTGKTTIARKVAGRAGATYLRIDNIEQAIRSAKVLVGDIGPAGYLAAYVLAGDNLGLGQIVVADCVNPLQVTRVAWRAVAEKADVPILEIEVICSDVGEHRRRVEEREVDIPGLVPPIWTEVLAHEYEPWTAERMVVDTARMDVLKAADRVCEEIEARRGV